MLEAGIDESVGAGTVELYGTSMQQDTAEGDCQQEGSGVRANSRQVAEEKGASASGPDHN